MVLHTTAVHVAPYLAAAGDEILKGANSACGSSCGPTDYKTIFAKAANVMTYLVGSISVLMVIYGGLRYVMSRGDASQIKVAKETILYAVVGVVVSVVAFAIVSFVAKTIK